MPRPDVPIDTSPNSYCGPYAVAHLCALKDTGEAARLIHEVRWRGRGDGRDWNGRRRPVRSAGNGEVLEALRRAGVRPIGRGHPGRKNRPTLARWLRGRRGGLYLVNVTGHYIVVDGYRIYDNAHPTGRKRKQWPHRRKRVVRWWRFR